MPSNYNTFSFVDSNSRFTRSYFGDVEHSEMTAEPLHITAFDAGELVPIYYREVLPDQAQKLSLDFVIRPSTMSTPTMGNMVASFFSFFVPNRVINQSWKAVEGENFSGSWTAPQVSLAPLVSTINISNPELTTYRVPVGSLADYYGFPTQQGIPASVLGLCNDLKFRGYVMIWNEFFRDQNYQAPIPMSTLNVYQGFFDSRDKFLYSDLARAESSTPSTRTVFAGTVPTGEFGNPAVAHSLYGSVSPAVSSEISPVSLSGHLYAFDKPLKVNKFHDYFTSVLPSPFKGLTPFIPVSGTISNSLPVNATLNPRTMTEGYSIKFSQIGGTLPVNATAAFTGTGDNTTLTYFNGSESGPADIVLTPNNLEVASGATVDGLEISIADIRQAAAIQQVFECLARGGSRYRELVNSFFGIEAENPYSDIPVCLGRQHVSLDVFQTAQTSASQEGSTAQGNLAAFGYTSKHIDLFDHTHIALEHGYYHVFVCVRHRNIYSSYLARDNFRLSALDFYLPQLANITEQPVYTREINPFSVDVANTPSAVFGYNEAWAEYRFEPDMVTGYMRPGIPETLSYWNYADSFDSSLRISDGEWLKSNSKEVLSRTLAGGSAGPQFKAAFQFHVLKNLPMPSESVPGLDLI